MSGAWRWLGTGPELTREKFIGTMEQIRDFDIRAFTISFTPTDRSGSRFVELTVDRHG